MSTDTGTPTSAALVTRVRDALTAAGYTEYDFTVPAAAPAEPMADRTPAGLNCPGCGKPPRFVLAGGQQAFCGNDDCPWFTWDPTLTLAELNADANVIDLRGWENPR